MSHVIPPCSGARRPHRGRRLAVLLAAITATWPMMSLGADDPSGPKSTKMTCQTCPETYVLTGVTTDPKMCPDGDHTVVQCSPIGANILSVCGTCPESYEEIGSSSLPSRCGTVDGGRASQCQLKVLEQQLPDPTQGGVVCPPHCGSSPAPGEGNLPSPPKFRPAPEKTDEKKDE